MLAAISLSLAAALGLGAPVALGALGLRAWRGPDRRPDDLILWLAVAWLAGLQVLYGLGLLIADLDALVAIGGGAAVLGIAVAVCAVALSANRHAWRPGPIVYIAILIVLAGIYAWSIGGTPIQAWDARSIWFFHAKAIYFDGGLAPSPFWAADAYDWSHKDYPKLVPLMAASFARSAGYWNEYLPKAALLTVLVPALFGFVAATRLHVQNVVPLLLILGYLGSYLWNGYMDAYVALYAVLAVLSVRLWLESGAPQHLMFGVLAVGVSLGLKQEGMIVGIALLLAGLLVSGARLRRVRSLEWRAAARWLMVLVLALGPMVLWRVKVVDWDLYGDMRPARLFDQFVGRVTDGAQLATDLSIMARYAMDHTHVFEAIGAAVVLFAMLWWRGALERGHVLLVLMSGAYAAAVVAIYLGTHHDFTWHIETSFLRVTLTLVALLLVAHFAMLATLIRTGRAPAEAAT